MSPLKSYSLSVNELIQACLKGNRAAQKELFQLYAPKMMALSRRYCRNVQEAEDVVQDGFVRIFTHLHQFNNEGSFEGWMKRVIINIALKNKTKKSYDHEELGLDSYLEEGILPTIVGAMTVNEINELIEELPEGYKNVFKLYVIEGYSHKEIGDLLEIGESTSRSQLVKARNLLQIKLINSQKIAV